MNRILFVVIILSIFLSDKSVACSCTGPITPSFHENTHEVFIGTVLRIKSEGFDGREFVFNVSEKVRGDFPKKLVLNSEHMSASCGRNYQVGLEYIVVIRRKDEKIYSGLCSSWSMSSELGKTVYEFLTILNEVAEPLTSSKTTAFGLDAFPTRPF